MKTRSYEDISRILSNSVTVCDYFDIYYHGPGRWYFVFYNIGQDDGMAHFLSAVESVPTRLMKAYRHHVKLGLFDELQF